MRKNGDMMSSDLSHHSYQIGQTFLKHDTIPMLFFVTEGMAYAVHCEIDGDAQGPFQREPFDEGTSESG